MSPKIDRTLIKKHQLEVGDFYFYTNYVVAELHEGVAFSIENATEILNLGKIHFGKQTPFVYITNRKNSYSFNPTAHFKTTPIFPNLKGFASVVYDDINKEIATLEQSFLNKPAEVFNNLEDAILWVEKMILLD